MFYFMDFNSSVNTYYLLILTKVECIDHLQKLELTISKLKEKALKCNIKKSIFGQTEIKSSGLGVTCDGIKPINKNNRSNT